MLNIALLKPDLNIDRNLLIKMLVTKETKEAKPSKLKDRFITKL